MPPGVAPADSCLLRLLLHCAQFVVTLLLWAAAFVRLLPYLPPQEVERHRRTHHLKRQKRISRFFVARPWALALEMQIDRWLHTKRN